MQTWKLDRSSKLYRYADLTANVRDFCGLFWGCFFTSVLIFLGCAVAFSFVGALILHPLRVFAVIGLFSLIILFVYLEDEGKFGDFYPNLLIFLEKCFHQIYRLLAFILRPVGKMFSFLFVKIGDGILKVMPEKKAKISKKKTETPITETQPSYIYMLYISSKEKFCPKIELTNNKSKIEQ